MRTRTYFIAVKNGQEIASRNYRNAENATRWLGRVTRNGYTVTERITFKKSLARFESETVSTHN